MNERLKACADFVSGKGIACDVGTDHAYLACELIKSEKCMHVIASDINEKPLNIAKSTIEKYNLSEKIDLVLSDGLKNISEKNVSDVIIAGMGGETIIDIINNCSWIKDGVNFILQPMTKAPDLRKWLYANGYKIIHEKAVRDGKFIYTVMQVEYSGKKIKLSEFSSIIGHLDFSLDISKEYLKFQIDKLHKIADGLKESGDFESAEKYCILYREIAYLKATKNLIGNYIYDILDELYPFSSQERWDNSGYLVGHGGINTDRILLSLDITGETVIEARAKNCRMIISHHPVIFNPLKSIHNNDVVYKLIKNDIGAVCMHTNLDIAEDGTNGVILERLSEFFEISSVESFAGIGKIITLRKTVSSLELAEVLKKIFDCKVIKYCGEWETISRIAICSGSGGSLLEEAISQRCQALITGDIKHDVWISANNQNFTLFDCGHFHTENIVLEHLKDVFEANFPFIEIMIAETSTDPVKYFI